MSRIKISFFTVLGILFTWILFKLFFYVTSLGYVSIGDSYCQFGPIPAKYASFEIHFKSNYSGQLTLIDKRGNQLSNNDYSVIVNGRKVGTSFRAPGKRLVTVKIRGNSNKVAGRTFVRVKGGGPLITHYFFRHHSNPFVYYLVAMITALTFVIVLWYVFLQRLFYPRFRNVRKTIIIPGQTPILIKFNGYREIELSNRPIKQSRIDRIIKGPIEYRCIPDIKVPIRMKPTSKGRKILFSSNAGFYQCIPNPIDSFIPATVVDNDKNKILIQ